MFDSFKAFYYGYLHHPLLLFIGPVALLAVLVARMRFVRGYLVAFAAIIISDALVTGPLLGWTRPGEPWGTAIVVLYVLLGDLRYYALLTRFGGEAGAAPRKPLRVWGGAWALTLVVPVAVAVPIATKMLVDKRHIFLCYEVLFVAWLLVLRLAILPLRLAKAEQATRAWLLSVSHFVLGHYALWALSDVIILSGHDIGYALRLVPNLMYYGLFLPYVYLKCPEELR